MSANWHLWILLCLTPDDFTRQWGTPWEIQGSDNNLLFNGKDPHDSPNVHIIQTHRKLTTGPTSEKISLSCSSEAS